MKKSLLICASIAAIAAAGATARIAASGDASGAFLNPSELSARICGRQGPDGPVLSRTPFITAAQAYDEAEGDKSAGAPVLWEGLSNAHFDITTQSEGAQAYFDQGLRFAFAFAVNFSQQKIAFATS